MTHCSWSHRIRIYIYTHIYYILYLYHKKKPFMLWVNIPMDPSWVWDFYPMKLGHFESFDIFSYMNGWFLAIPYIDPFGSARNNNNHRIYSIHVFLICCLSIGMGWHVVFIQEDADNNSLTCYDGDPDMVPESMYTRGIFWTHECFPLK